MRAAVITQARSTSARLPGKVLLEVGGRTLLDHHLDRLQAAGLEVVLATTVNAADDPIAALGEHRGLPVVRGSEHDVLGRYADAVRTVGLDAVVRVTSDCPLIDGGLIRAGLDHYLAAGDPDLYVTNTLPRTFPRGFDYEVFSSAALLAADAAAEEPVMREHVTPFLYQNVSGRTRVHNLAGSPDRSEYRVTIDTPEDLRLIRALIEEHHAEKLDCARIIALLDARPELVALNAGVEQKKLGE
ncbi:cytidylyltransferase domain-containing protein [Nocardioides insulae]|uniref:cytidylyltransferase domain-containing protein n=1 Tax=Nocardioides insulae TaxID=394734 RepID=UPI00041589FE|nr:glycosyltransferase family protein [Nocardioides insulae]